MQKNVWCNPQDRDWPPNSSTILSEQRVKQRITEANGAVYGKYFSALGLCDMMIYIYIYLLILVVGID